MKTLFLILTFIVFPNIPNASSDAVVGSLLNNIRLKNADDKEAYLPHWGQKVLAVFYTDPDVKDVNNPLTDAIKAKGFNKEKYAGIGIANCAKTWLPNAAIRYAAKEKEKKYPGSVVLIDDDELVEKGWKLPDGNEKGFILVIGKDQKIKYLKAVQNQEESKAIIKTVIAVIEAEIGK